MHTTRQRDVFDGTITGWGTASGLRFVAGDWRTSPFGAFTDVMVAHPDGRRELLAPSDRIAEYVATTYHFDAVSIVPVELLTSGTSRHLAAGPLEAHYTVGKRQPWGYLLRAVPRSLVSPHLARCMNTGARIVMPGVRTYGTAGNGRREFYVAQDLHAVSGLVATWGEESLGQGGPVKPEPHFGFSSTPQRPSCTTVTTFIEFA